MSHGQSSTYSVKISGTKIPTNVFDDFGPTRWGDLVTTIVTGAGTTRRTLADVAKSSVSGATLKLDAPTLKAAMTAAASSVRRVAYIPNAQAQVPSQFSREVFAGYFKSDCPDRLLAAISRWSRVSFVRHHEKLSIALDAPVRLLAKHAESDPSFQTMTRNPKCLLTAAIRTARGF